MERHGIKKLIKGLRASEVFKVVLNTSVKIKPQFYAQAIITCLCFQLHLAFL